MLSKAAAKFKQSGQKTEQLEDPDEELEEEYELEDENMSELQYEGAEEEGDDDEEEYNVQYVEVRENLL